MRYIVGIDPGVNTGLAVYDRHDKRLAKVETHGIIDAMQKVLEIHLMSPIELRFEDARQRKWFGKADREVLQGAGSVKRDCQIWEDFCRYHGIKVTMVAPKDTMTKINADLFRKLTGWAGKTNEHGRDAALLVYGC